MVLLVGCMGGGLMKYVPNRRGLREVLASPEAASLVGQHADRLAAAAGDGFVASKRMGRTRQRAIVYADTWSAKHRQRRGNILTRVLG